MDRDLQLNHTDFKRHLKDTWIMYASCTSRSGCRVKLEYRAIGTRKYRVTKVNKIDIDGWELTTSRLAVETFNKMVLQ